MVRKILILASLSVESSLATSLISCASAATACPFQLLGFGFSLGGSSLISGSGLIFFDASGMDGLKLFINGLGHGFIELGDFIPGIELGHIEGFAHQLGG